MDERTWVDDVAFFNAIALSWYQNLTQPATTSAGAVQVSSTGVSASLSPGLVIVLIVLGVALIWAARS